MTTEMPYKPNDYTLHPKSMSVLGFNLEWPDENISIAGDD